MYRIIPFIIFFAAFAYLFFSPAPMDKIGKTVKNRDCYQLRLMDQERLLLSHEEKNPTASLQKEDELQKITLNNGTKPDVYRLAMGKNDK